MTGEATVVKNAGSHYMLSMLPEWNPFPAVLKGRIRLKANDSTNPVAVGDKVRFEADAESADGVTLTNPALITEILDRKNYVVRKSTNLSRQSHVIAANIDMAFAVATLYFPEVKLPFLSISGKYLAISSFSRLTRPKPLRPGVSITVPPEARRYISYKEVVCFP